MKIYAIDNIRDKVILDIPEFQSIDHYLFKNPYLKRLVYAYLKLTKEPVKLTELDSLFSKTIDIEYYSSDEHLKKMETNPLYLNLYNLYIQNPNSWVHGSMQAQSYFFDSKNLLKGDFQEKISEVVDLAIRSIAMHYTVKVSNFHQNTKYQDFYQRWFDKKKEIEHDFFSKMLSENLMNEKDKSIFKIQCYNDMIEIYDIESTLTLQFNIKSYTNTILKILMPKLANRSTKDKRNTLVPKFLSKCEFAMKLYQWLIDGKNIAFINLYLEKIEIHQTQPQYKLMVSSIEKFLEDVRNQEESTYINSEWLIMQMCHKNVVEKNVIHFSNKNSLLRIYRKIKYVDNESIEQGLNEKEFELRPYSIPKNLERAAKWLLNNGFITFSSNEDKLNQKTFEDLASRKTNNESKLFMRLPILDSAYIFNLANDEVQEFEKEIEQAIGKKYKIEYSDTRNWSKNFDESMSTYFETMAYLSDKKEFKQQRVHLNHEKVKLVHGYINKNKNLIKLIDKIIEDENTEEKHS